MRVQLVCAFNLNDADLSLKKFAQGFLAVIFIILFCLTLTGCSTTPKSEPTYPVRKTDTTASKSTPTEMPRAGSGRGGYYQDDGPMDDTPENLHAIPDAIPRVEAYARGPNKPYTIFGKTYTPVTDNRPYKARGYGSWYGKKFHGNKTSSGEVYDMFKMTAAHPTLPIPCYVRVTNVSNGRQVIVRVNDRGPFHSDRIIDLSYTAALKLDYLNKGSALLEVEHLLPDEIERINIARNQNQTWQGGVTDTAKQHTEEKPRVILASTSPVTAKAENSNITSRTAAYYLQLGAYQQLGNAQSTQAEYALQWAHVLPSFEVVMSEDNFYRLFAGPFHTQEEADYAAKQLEIWGKKSLIVRR